MFSEKPLKVFRPPVDSLCTEYDHRFLTDPRSRIIPPGTPCSCGRKVMIYEQCACCGRSGAVIKDMRQLQEGENV